MAGGISNGILPQPTGYTVMNKTVVRSDVGLNSSSVGVADVGEVIWATESGITESGVPRVKCDRGWLSVRATDGTILLQELQQQRPGVTGAPLITSAAPQSLTEGSLTAFCAAHKFSAFIEALEKLGVAEAIELADVTDGQLAQVGFNGIQIKRLRRLVPAAGLDQSVEAANTTL